MKLLKENVPFTSRDACFIDEYRLLGAVPSQGDQSKCELALWDTSCENPSPVRFETKFPLTEFTKLHRNRESNPELPFHGDLSAGIVCVETQEALRDVLVIRVRDFIALSKGCEGRTVSWSEWESTATKLSDVPYGFSVLHSQVAYFRPEDQTPVLYVHDFSRHLKWEGGSNPNGPPERTHPTPGIPKAIELLHNGMEHPSQYMFTVTEGGVYAIWVS